MRKIYKNIWRYSDKKKGGTRKLLLVPPVDNQQLTLIFLSNTPLR